MRVLMRFQQKATLFWQENLPACVAFFLFLCLGAACGFFAGRELYGAALPVRAQAMLAEWMQPHCLRMLLFAVLAEVGNNRNTLEEALAALPALAEAIAAALDGM